MNLVGSIARGDASVQESVISKRILVTAATGTVGGATMQALRGLGIDALGAARSVAGADKLRRHGFTPVPFDYDRPDTLRPALEGVDAVFLSTGYSVAMLIHSKRLLDTAKAEGVRHIVHLGALAPADTPHAHFGWHQLVERAIEAMGFSYTHLQPNFFMDTVWTGFRHRPDRLVHFIGEHTVSWIAAADIAAVAAQALCHPARHAGQTYPLAVEALPLRQVAALLAEATGSTVQYHPRPAADLLPVLLKQGMEPGYAAGLAEGLTEIEAGRLPLAASIYQNFLPITGRAPMTWREFIRHQLAAVQGAGPCLDQHHPPSPAAPG